MAALAFLFEGYMAYLTSANTTDECKAAYQDNASYDVQGDTSMAAYFIDACRQLIQRLPSELQSTDASRIRYELSEYREQLDKAERWLAARTTTSGVVGRKIQRTLVKYVDTST